MIRHNNENGSVNVSTGVYTDIAGTVSAEVAAETGYVKASEIDVLKEWRISPSTWGK